MCCVDEVAQQVLVIDIVVQILLGSLECVQLLDTVVVLGNVWELELLSIDVRSVNSNVQVEWLGSLFKKIALHKESIEELLFIKSSAEFFPGAAHFDQGIVSVHDSVLFLLFYFLLGSF